jgi:hypothetical protein
MKFKHENIHLSYSSAAVHYIFENLKVGFGIIALFVVVSKGRGCDSDFDALWPKS